MYISSTRYLWTQNEYHNHWEFWRLFGYFVNNQIKKRILNLQKPYKDFCLNSTFDCYKLNQFHQCSALMQYLVMIYSMGVPYIEMCGPKSTHHDDAKTWKRFTDPSWGNSLVTNGFASQGPVMRSYDISVFVLSLNKLLKIMLSVLWYTIWPSCDVIVIQENVLFPYMYYQYLNHYCIVHFRKC